MCTTFEDKIRTDVNFTKWNDGATCFFVCLLTFKRLGFCSFYVVILLSETSLTWKEEENMTFVGCLFSFLPLTVVFCRWCYDSTEPSFPYQANKFVYYDDDDNNNISYFFLFVM